MDLRSIPHALDSAATNLGERLDHVESTLPTVPAKMLGVCRATARRGNDTARSVVDRTVDSVSGARARLDGVVGVLDRSRAVVFGQARAEARLVAESVGAETERALDDARLAVDPDQLTTRTKAELLEVAARLDVAGRSSMTKAELVDAIQKI